MGLEVKKENVFSWNHHDIANKVGFFLECDSRSEIYFLGENFKSYLISSIYAKFQKLMRV